MGQNGGRGDTELRLEKIHGHGNGWRATNFGDPLEYKCITLWCVYRYDWTGPEDCSHHGPQEDNEICGSVWIYSTLGDAVAAMEELNEGHFRMFGRVPDGGERGPWGVHPAPMIRHGDEDEATEWLREQQLIE